MRGDRIRRGVTRIAAAVCRPVFAALLVGGASVAACGGAALGTGSAPGGVKDDAVAEATRAPKAVPVMGSRNGMYRDGAYRATPSAAAPCGVASRPPATYDHVVWIVFENKSYADIVGNSAAPYLNGLVAKCGLATAMYAETHPSLPNYLAMTSGSTQGVTDDMTPAAHQLSAASIFSQLGSTGWRSLQESMPAPCYLWNSGSYAVRHNPATYYTNVRTACQSRDVALGSSVNIGARFTFVTPNLCSDMHDCSVATGDKWLAAKLPQILNSATYAAGRTAVFVTWDEDDKSANNRIATMVVAPSVPKGTRSGTHFDHYSMLRTAEQMLGITWYLGKAATATSMRGAFHL
jgi:hypothetical protein